MSVRTALPLLIPLCLCSVSPAAEPKLDRVGDPLPEGAIARLGSLDLRNEIPILTAAFTADGKTLATGDAVSIAFWDLATGKCMRRVPLKGATPGTLRRLSDDAKILMLCDFKNVLHFIDAASGAEQGTLNYAQCGLMRDWPHLSRDGKILAAVHQASVAVWDVEGGKLLHEFKEPSLARVATRGLIALTPDGKQLVLPHADGSLHLVEVASGKEVRAFEMPPSRQPIPPSLPFSRMVLSADGRYLAFGGPVTPWSVCELATGKRLHQLRLSQNPVHGLAFTPNGRFLAVDQFNEIRLIGVLSGKEIRKLPKKTPGPSLMLVFSPDGRTLAEFPSAPIIRLWDMVAQRRLHPLIGHEGRIQAIALFPDGKRLVSADSENVMKVWDIASGQSLAQRTNTPSESLAIDRDGESVRFAGYSSAYHWDPRTGREEVRGYAAVGVSSALAVSPDGRSLVVRWTDGMQRQQVSHQLHLYDLKTKKFRELPAPPQPIGIPGALFAPDGRRLAARCYDGTILLWDRDTGKLVREFKSEAPGRMSMPLTLAFAADGQSLLSWSGRVVRICEIASGADRLQIPPVPNMFSLAYSPDARFIACGGRDGRVLVYSAVSGKQLAQWQSKQGYIHALAFGRDGSLLASGGANGTILVWKAPEDDSVPVVRKAEEADSLWQALGDSDAVAANRALAGLAAAPAQVLPLFKERLSTIGKQLERTQFADLIADLDNDSFKVRERAMRELALAGPNAADALREALHKNPSAEVKRRIEDLLERLKKGGDSQRLRFLRALEVLERIGAPQAKDVLRSLADQSLPPDLREEVQASLSRLGEKP